MDIRETLYRLGFRIASESFGAGLVAGTQQALTEFVGRLGSGTTEVQATPGQDGLPPVAPTPKLAAPPALQLPEGPKKAGRPLGAKNKPKAEG